MKPEELKDIYKIPPEDFHNAVLFSLCKLDSESPARYKTRRRALRIAVVCAVAAVLGSFTAVAAATDFFGLFSQPVGEYGLRLAVAEDATEKQSEPLRNVKMNFGYMTEGYTQVPHTGTDVVKYHIDGIENSPWYTFSVTPAKDFDFTEEYVIKSRETAVNGHKLILTTCQMFEGGEVDYGAVMYFEDWGYVVGGGAYGGAEESELLKIMQNLTLEDNGEYVPDSNEYAPDNLEPIISEYVWDVQSEFKIHKLGEAFEWGKMADENGSSDDFTVKVSSIKEQDSTEGIPGEYFNFMTDYSLIYSDYFDENGRLITPYTRRDFTESDGVNSQRKAWDTEDDRHFYVVTIEVTQNTDEPYSEFDVFSDFSPIVLIKDSDGYRYNGKEDGNGITQTELYGDVNTVCSTPGDEANVLNMQKGETRTLTYGIVVDDDVLENAYLRFNTQSRETVDDESEKIILSYRNDCVKIKG